MGQVKHSDQKPLEDSFTLLAPKHAFEAKVCRDVYVAVWHSGWYPLLIAKRKALILGDESFQSFCIKKTLPMHTYGKEHSRMHPHLPEYCCRNWHLPGVIKFSTDSRGCRGFIGPVPPPLSIRAATIYLFDTKIVAKLYIFVNTEYLPAID